MDVELDHRFIALGAALAAGSKESARPEHRLVSGTRRKLAEFAAHTAVGWLWEQVRRYELLTLAMQVEHLAGPPDFRAVSAAETPVFVDEFFSMVPREAASSHLSQWWRDAGLEELLKSQGSAWEHVVRDVMSVLGPIEVEEFQVMFFGQFPYKYVFVPAANMPFVGVRAVGVATNREIRAVCLPYDDNPYSEHASDLLVVAQHEASHVMVDLLQRRHPTVTEDCLFVERTCPPGARFASAYGDPGFRFVETLIRASSCFFLRSLGMDDRAGAFIASQLSEGVSAVELFVRALEPWWQLRVRGRCGGLDEYFVQLPSELRKVVAARG